MVEMLETASILNNATAKSLILLDEIGRGTSTYDGLSIASAISEYIYTTIQSQTFFATHYHELSQLSEQFKGIQNYCMTINEISGKLLFTYKIQKGATDKSYGLHVASMAGIPNEVLNRATQFLSFFETQNHSGRMTQLKLF
jgi:DNA mismatch repair protein MutS